MLEPLGATLYIRVHSDVPNASRRNHYSNRIDPLLVIVPLSVTLSGLGFILVVKALSRKHSFEMEFLLVS